ncbi:MAG: two-component regulator propeller domain-containing protein, partial [Dehalococcoidia bacterium]|nr:two-component regulator propeller domain-containing protein [Dehalococcoidia bacterium]
MRLDIKRIGGFSFVALAGLMAFTVTLPPTTGERNADRWTVYNMANTSLSSWFLTEIFEDSKDRLWFAGFDNGASVLDDGAMRTFNATNSVIEERVTSFMETLSGDIWLGNEDGVAIWDGATWSSLEMSEVPLGTSHVSTLFRDSSDRVWVGTWGGGTAVLDGEVWTGYSSADELPGDQVWSIGEDVAGTVWIGTRTGLASLSSDGDWSVYTTENSDLVSNRVKSISYDNDDNIY